MAMFFLRFVLFIAVAYQLGNGFSVEGFRGPHLLMPYQLLGLSPGRISMNNQRNPLHNLRLQQTITGDERSPDDMELLTEIALHDAKNNEIFYENLPNNFEMTNEPESKLKDDMMKMNFTEIDPDMAADHNSIDDGNPLVVFNVHLEYLTNSIDKMNGNLITSDIHPFLAIQEKKNKINKKSFKKIKQFLDFEENRLFFKAKEETPYESNVDETENYIAPADEFSNLLGNFKKSYFLADALSLRGKPKESNEIKPKRGFSLLTRWRPFSKLGQGSWLRRPYFQAILRHGDNTLTAQASSLSRPYGTPLRWG